MPGDRSSKPSKQSVLAVKKAGQSNVETADILEELEEIKQSLQGTLTKVDLEKSMSCLVKHSDLKEIVTTIVNQLLTTFRDTLAKELDDKLRERTGILYDRIDGMAIENENLRERLRSKDKTIEALEEKVLDSDKRSMEALRQANYNEQYSRKHNIRVLSYPEKRDEDLSHDFINLVRKDLKVDVLPEEITAIHRIPGKQNLPRPVIVKFKNTEVKSRIMRQKKNLKEVVKFHDDITHRNIGLMSRLKRSEKFHSVWFFNDSVYAKTSTEGRKIRFDIFDNIEEKMKQHGKVRV